MKLVRGVHVQLATFEGGDLFMNINYVHVH